MHKLTLVISFTVHYNDDVLVPFIESIREKLGWTKGQPVPDYLRCCSWFDGDIGQLQTMLFEAREAMDDFLNIVRNKHSAAATGTQQPCDLSPVFRLLKLMQKNTTATDKTSVGLREDLEELFSVYLKNCGLNLNIRKRKALMDFLLCLPDNLEAVLKEKHIKKSFVEAGMIDEKTGMMPVFDKLIGTCKRWVSADKKIGIPKVEKDQCREQFQPLMRRQFEEGGLSYHDMKEVLPKAVWGKFGMYMLFVLVHSLTCYIFLLIYLITCRYQFKGCTCRGG